MNSEKRPPMIALVGRPNVGKSSLFNRLLGRRKAITDPTAGVTRDPVEAVWDWEGQVANLVDTGGYQSEGSHLDMAVTRRSVEKAREADLILLILDVMEMTLEDEDFIRLLRPYSEKILLVLNKVDSPEREAQAWDFYSLGFEDVICVSAAHGRNVGELEERIRERLSHLAPVEKDPDPEMRLAILGKPNAGKSTLVNHLTQTELSLVSDMPGTTRDAIEGRFSFRGKVIQVVDTAGIRRKGKVTDNVEYYSVNRAIKTIGECDVVVLLIDAIENLSDQDKKIAGLVVDQGKGLILGLNKWDEVGKMGNQQNAYTDKIRFHFPAVDFAPILMLSAKTGQGTQELLTMALKVYDQLRQRIETPKLNEMLRYWTEDVPPPQSRGKVFKIRYLTQVSANPVKFVAFVNHEKGMPQSYMEYIKNRIRKDLGFSLVPVEIQVRGSQA